MRSLGIHELTVRYGGVMAVSKLSVEFASGQIAGVVGPNGAGKSSVLGAASGFIRPAEGFTTIDGVRQRPGRPHELAVAGIRRSFQTARPLHALSVLDNVRLGAFASGRTRLVEDLLATRRARREQRIEGEAARTALGDVGLGDRADDPVSTLSYGQLRLMELARALVADPWLLLLDEPAAGLNVSEADELGALLQRLVAGRGLGVVLVEHNLGLVMEICDVLHVLEYGQLIASGDPSTVAREPQVVAAYTGMGA